MVKLIGYRKGFGTETELEFVKWLRLPSVREIRRRFKHDRICDFRMEMLLRGKIVLVGEIWYYLVWGR